MTATTEAEQAKLNNAILAKEKALSEKKDRYEDQAKALDHMGEALREAGVNTDNLTEESKRLEQEMARLRNEQEQAAGVCSPGGNQNRRCRNAGVQYGRYAPEDNGADGRSGIYDHR